MITLTKKPLKLVCSENLFVSDTWFGWQTPLRTPSLPLDRLVKGCTLIVVENWVFGAFRFGN